MKSLPRWARWLAIAVLNISPFVLFATSWLLALGSCCGNSNTTKDSAISTLFLGFILLAAAIVVDIYIAVKETRVLLKVLFAAISLGLIAIVIYVAAIRVQVVLTDARTVNQTFLLTRDELLEDIAACRITFIDVKGFNEGIKNRYGFDQLITAYYPDTYTKSGKRYIHSTNIVDPADLEVAKEAAKKQGPPCKDIIFTELDGSWVAL